jgi:hypothetical protein
MLVLLFADQSFSKAAIELICLWAAEYCERINITQYKKIMLCDSRDVVFQSDMFDKADHVNFVTGAEEGVFSDAR